jgi:hypothetical protein
LRSVRRIFSEFIALRNSILQSFANGSEELLEGSAVALLANGHETLNYISIVMNWNKLVYVLPGGSAIKGLPDAIRGWVGLLATKATQPPA